MGAALFFSYCIYVQHNDVDAPFWMAIYVLPLGLALWSLYRPPLFFIPAAIGLTTFAGSAFVALEVLGDEGVLWSEAGREMMGLLTVALYAGGLALWSRAWHRRGLSSVA